MSEKELIAKDIEDYLERHRRKEILRFLTCGSVDDGKSTLIGRLLHDSNMIYDDQLAALHRDSAKKSSAGGEIDYSLLVDGLLSEREQGITIDVAYRYFATEKRKFIIADTPGHEQYTRNMATGASTADLAIILVDARQGVLPQTRRHSVIASLLGIRHAVVAVNKMDLVSYDQSVFDAIRETYLGFASKLRFGDVHFIPLSALRGDNVVTKTGAMPWYDGPPLLRYLENVPIGSDRNLVDLRFPVQYVMRPNLDFRGFSGTIASGTLRRGDAVLALPSEHKSRVRSIVTYDGDLEDATPPMAVTVTLEDEIDVSRGDVLVREADLPHVARAFDATVVWMNESPLRPGATYLVKHGTRVVAAEVTALKYALDITTLTQRDAPALGLNDIGHVTFTAARPLIFDAYARNRSTGAFIVIDRLTNATVGAGMIEGPAVNSGAAAEDGRVTVAERERRLGQRGASVAVGDARVASLLERLLWNEGYTAYVVEVGADPASRARAAAITLACGELGIITILTGPLEPDAAIATRVLVMPAPHGDDIGAAAAEALRALHGAGVLR